jgi:hypothetical protein
MGRPECAITAHGRAFLLITTLGWSGTQYPVYDEAGDFAINRSSPSGKKCPIAFQAILLALYQAYKLCLIFVSPSPLNVLQAEIW